MEILVILGIVIILGVLLPTVLKPRRRISGNDGHTYASIRNLESALELYAYDHNKKLPQTSEGLLVLFVNNGQDPQWQGPYLKNATELPTDAWGNPIQYRYPGTKSKGKPDIWSWGRDERNGTEDDITNWMSPDDLRRF